MGLGLGVFLGGICGLFLVFSFLLLLAVMSCLAVVESLEEFFVDWASDDVVVV